MGFIRKITFTAVGGLILAASILPGCDKPDGQKQGADPVQSDPVAAVAPESSGSSSSGGAASYPRLDKDAIAHFESDPVHAKEVLAKCKKMEATFASSGDDGTKYMTWMATDDGMECQAASRAQLNLFRKKQREELGG